MDNNKAVLIRKANDMILSRYSLPLNAQRLQALAAKKIMVGDSHEQEYEVTVHDFEEITEGKNPYEQLSNGAKHLFDAEIIIVSDENNDSNQKGKEPTGQREISAIRWVNKCTYVEGESKVRVRFNKEIHRYYTRILEPGNEIASTEYDMLVAKPIYNANSMRVYERFMMERGEILKGNISLFYKLEEFKKTLKIENRYTRLTDLRRYIIEPLIKDINMISNITVTWQKHKQGRSVTGIVFNIDYDFTDEVKVSGS